MKFLETEHEQRIDLGDNTYICLLQRNTATSEFKGTIEEYSRNVYRMTDSGDALWRINWDCDGKGSPFTQLFVNENSLVAYNSNGFRYRVDWETGEAETHDYPLLGPWKQRPLPSGYPATRFVKMQSEQRVYLDDGTYLFLAERNADAALTGLSPEDYARNVFRMTESGEILWTIQTERDGFASPFIKLFLDADSRKMANRDGLIYCVDLETGNAHACAQA